MSMETDVKIEDRIVFDTPMFLAFGSLMFMVGAVALAGVLRLVGAF